MLAGSLAIPLPEVGQDFLEFIEALGMQHTTGEE
jgi:hypothetical protein